MATHSDTHRQGGGIPMQVAGQMALLCDSFCDITAVNEAQARDSWRWRVVRTAHCRLESAR